MSRPAAFRRSYDEVRVTRVLLESSPVWPAPVRWWAMAARLKAVEVCGTQDVRGRLLEGCLEFRRPDA